MSKIWQGLKSRGSGPLYTAHDFLEVLENVEPITYMKFQNILMTVCKDMDKKLQKYPKHRTASSTFNDDEIIFSLIVINNFKVFLNRNIHS